MTLFICVPLFRGGTAIVITRVCFCPQDNSWMHWWVSTKLGSYG